MKKSLSGNEGSGAKGGGRGSHIGSCTLRIGPRLPFLGLVVCLQVRYKMSPWNESWAEVGSDVLGPPVAANACGSFGAQAFPSESAGGSRRAGLVSRAGCQAPTRSCSASGSV